MGRSTKFHTLHITIIKGALPKFTAIHSLMRALPTWGPCILSPFPHSPTALPLILYFCHGCGGPSIKQHCVCPSWWLEGIRKVKWREGWSEEMIRKAEEREMTGNRERRRGRVEEVEEQGNPVTWDQAIDWILTLIKHPLDSMPCVCACVCVCVWSVLCMSVYICRRIIRTVSDTSSL